jgi:hypothetical protein
MATLGSHLTGSIVVSGKLISSNQAFAPVTAQLKGTTGGPNISALPSALDFGQVAIGTSHTKRLLVSNTGFSPLTVTSIKPDMQAGMVFAAAPSMFRLAAGSSTVVQVSFTPTAEQTYAGNLLLDSNDGSTPELAVAIHGQGVNLPPCSYTIMPPMVNFGVVNARMPAQQTVHVMNTGMNDCLMGDEAIAPQIPDFRLPNGSESNVRLMPGASHDIPVSFTPFTGGTVRSNLTFYISNPMMSNPVVPLSGDGEGTTQLVCPPDQMTPAGSAVNLQVQIVTQGTMVSSLTWNVDQAPPGGAGTPNQWTPAPPTQPTEQFLPYIVGVYTISVSLKDNLDNMYTCQTHVTAIGHGLRIEMDAPEADIDLHTHNQNMTSWFSGDDCFYGNCPVPPMIPGLPPLPGGLQWDRANPAGTVDNPALDYDPTMGVDTEHDRIDVPTVGETYTIAVHNYCYTGGGQTVTIQIWCGGVTTPNQTFTSMINGVRSDQCGNANAGQFWKVASVRFDSMTTCTITPIDTFMTGADAVAHF